MKRISAYYIISFCFVTVIFIGCKKNSDPAPTNTTQAGTVLSSEANVVISPTYVKLANDAASFYNGTVLFQSATTQTNLNSCRQLWLTVTADYEQSAASLFGPNGAIGADPASLINTYPIDTAGINTLVNSSAIFTPAYIDSLPSYLIGFHGVEFVLYGINGNKAATQFTPHQLSYITAVALNIKTLTWQLDSEWSAANTNSYYYQFVNAGSGSTVYPDQRAAFSDLTMAIANICETDAIYKFEGILNEKSVILQESPFANNSIADIANNLDGVYNIYYGQYGSSAGTGLTAFVSQGNPGLDTKIKNAISSAQKAVSLITVPLSQAIYTQTSQVNVAANACDTLDDYLKVDLLLYLNSSTN